MFFLFQNQTLFVKTVIIRRLWNPIATRCNLALSLHSHAEGRGCVLLRTRNWNCRQSHSAIVANEIYFDMSVGHCMYLCLIIIVYQCEVLIAHYSNYSCWHICCIKSPDFIYIYILYTYIYTSALTEICLCCAIQEFLYFILLYLLWYVRFWHCYYSII